MFYITSLMPISASASPRALSDPSYLRARMIPIMITTMEEIV